MLASHAGAPSILTHVMRYAVCATVEPYALHTLRISLCVEVDRVLLLGLDKLLALVVLIKARVELTCTSEMAST